MVLSAADIPAATIGWTRDWTAVGGFGAYALEKLVGKGSYGHVVAAKRQCDGMEVAIKRITNVFESRRDALCILREIRILSSIPAHPNIVTLVDVRTPLGGGASSRDADVYLVFERVCTDLEKVVSSNQFFSSEHVRWLLLDLLKAVHHMRDCGIVHRDLKPANMLLEVEPIRLKTSSGADLQTEVCDFGLARSLLSASKVAHDADGPATPPAQNDDDDDPLIPPPPTAETGPSSKLKVVRRQLTTHVVTRWLNLRYRAPELLLRSPLYTEAVDMWSVGCILAELLSMEEASVPCHLDRQPLFPGVSSDMTPSGDDISNDQLEVIVRICGAPTESDAVALGVMDPRGQARLATLTATKRVDLASLYPGADAQALDILRRMITINPTHRTTAQDALQHAYMASTYAVDSASFPTAPVDLDFDLTPLPLALSGLREMILAAAQDFADKSSAESQRPRPSDAADGAPTKKRRKEDGGVAAAAVLRC